MIPSHDLLRSYLVGLRCFSGARTVSLYMPAERGSEDKALLLHEGEAAPVAELVDRDQAEAALKRISGSPGTTGVQFHPSRSSDGCLIRVVGPSSSDRSGPGQGSGRRAVDHEPPAAELPEAWIGLRLGEGSPDPAEIFSPKERGAHWLIELGAALGWHSQRVSRILDDPVTGLPGRAEFQVWLQRGLDGARRSSKPLTVMLLNPDDFSAVNERFGPEGGDKVLREVALRIRTALRNSDLVARYGGAIFVALLAKTDRPAGVELATRVLAAVEQDYLDGSLKLAHSIGLATFEPPDPTISQPLHLMRRADRALKVAKWGGGGCLRCWAPAIETEAAGNVDRLTGVFTGQMSKDYRNMRLLSDTATIVAGSSDRTEMATRLVELLHSTLRCDRAMLVDWSGDSSRQVLAARSRAQDPQDPKRLQDFEPDEAVQAILEAARQEGRAVERDLENAASSVGFAVPLIAGEACLGCLYLDGKRNRGGVETSDLLFLEALATQIAVALDRARLSEVEKRWQERERQKLRAEVDELRQVLQQAELVCRSPQMKQLMATARRVAQTDATVLIRGESGTGKELLSKTIHELSPRSHKPLVMVDCASIPATLIESELFGHERGAYTGAQQRKLGRVTEADGGTLILDEIGELPIEVQSKLLRFVQEKQFCPVGGNQVRSVDARVVAVTNRNLEQEVREGHFREDLFHRLNVIRLELPPLRERPDDILSLAEHFLKHFSVQYQKGVLRRLSPEAEARIASFPWPGNVRQLKNRIMQAVILAEGEEIGLQQLDLAELADSSAPVAARPSPDALVEDRPPAPDPTPVAAGTPAERSADEIWARLGLTLGAAIDAALHGGTRRPAPLGRWLSEDLVIEAHDAAAGVVARGADLLGVPEATFRRKLRKAQDQREAGLSPRSESWPAVHRALAELVREAELRGGNLIRQTRDLLLGLVVERVEGRGSTGAALMGVTEPTYRRWLAELPQAPPVSIAS